MAREVLLETTYDTEALNQYVLENEPRLTTDQLAISQRVSTLFDKGEGGIVFIDAPGGTGKTFLLTFILARFRARGKIALAVTSSGIAAQLLPNGKTAHSAFRIPLNLLQSDKPLCHVKQPSPTATLLRQCSLIVWDEATMSNKRAFEALDRTLQDIRQSSKPFGNVLMILSGDFRKTLPIIKNGTRPNEVAACIKSSYIWPLVESHSMTTNMRVYLHRDDEADRFPNMLLSVGNGKIPTSAKDTIEIPPTLANVLHSRETVIERIYPDLHRNYNNVSWLMQRAILAPHNDTANDINATILEKFPGEQKIYLSLDSVKDHDDAATQYPTEFLNTLQPQGMPPHKLKLKIGVPLMVVRNMATGLANGTRLILKAMMRRSLLTTVSTGPRTGEDVYLPMIPLSPSDTDLPFTFTRLQFPVKLCFAMTTNKSQGQTLRTVGLDLSEPCFSHGQFYVGCSRVSSSRNISIYSRSLTTRNVVYPEVIT